MLARIKQTDLSVPYRKGDFLYYTRTEEGKQYPLYCRRKGDLQARHGYWMARGPGGVLK